VLLPLGDAVISWRQHPGWFAVYWMVVLGLAAWVMALALGDLLATRAHSRAALARLRQQQRELEREAAQLRARAGNGASEKA
jgi:cell division protein FtsB